MKTHARDTIMKTLARSTILRVNLARLSLRTRHAPLASVISCSFQLALQSTGNSAVHAWRSPTARQYSTSIKSSDPRPLVSQSLDPHENRSFYLEALTSATRAIITELDQLELVRYKADPSSESEPSPTAAVDGGRVYVIDSYNDTERVMKIIMKHMSPPYTPRKNKATPSVLEPPPPPTPPVAESHPWHIAVWGNNRNVSHVVGFDTETTVFRNRTSIPPHVHKAPSTLQLSLGVSPSLLPASVVLQSQLPTSFCVIFRVFKMCANWRLLGKGDSDTAENKLNLPFLETGKFPPSLARFCNHDRFLKVGVCATMDGQLLDQYYNTKCQNILDLDQLSRFTFLPSSSLQALTYMYYDKMQIPKNKNLIFINWDAKSLDMLPRDSIIYAARDAFLGVDLLYKMVSPPETIISPEVREEMRIKKYASTKRKSKDEKKGSTEFVETEVVVAEAVGDVVTDAEHESVEQVELRAVVQEVAISEPPKSEAVSNMVEKSTERGGVDRSE
ncbi:hypothetical protein BJ742DRAFT_854272 [Cladochytrium replicatum]|nr:hypothetical protein BJ742DRAFT_854272 [Cladochytrium replicatum]